MNIEGKVWVVTGGGSGMGRELTLALLRKGAKVATCDINEDALKGTVDLAGEKAANLSTHIVNIADKNRVEEFPVEVLEKHGQIDGIINNAGIIQPFIKVADLDYEVIERIVNINFYGTLYMIKAFLPHLQKRPEAHIANVASMGGFLPVPGQTFYGASKAAVKLLTEGLHSELGDTHIQVTCIFPGAVATNITTNSGVSTPGQDKNKAEKSKIKPLPANEAAEIMIKGIQANKYHVFVGKDSKMMNLLWRLAPKKAAAIIAKSMKSIMD